MEGKHVYQAIAEVTTLLAKSGVAKNRKNTQQGYQFRGIDDVYNALAPALAQASLCILPRVTARSVTERTTQKGGVLFYVVCDMEFDFVSAVDASSHTIAVIGEAMDSADKATNKAMSAAYKYAAMLTFCIPTEGAEDADATTHDVAATQDTEQWLAAIDDADNTTLGDIAAELARTAMPAAQKAKLRAAFAARKHALGESNATA